MRIKGDAAVKTCHDFLIAPGLERERSFVSIEISRIRGESDSAIEACQRLVELSELPINRCQIVVRAGVIRAQPERLFDEPHAVLRSALAMQRHAKQIQGAKIRRLVCQYFSSDALGLGVRLGLVFCYAIEKSALKIHYGGEA